MPEKPTLEKLEEPSGNVLHQKEIRNCEATIADCQNGVYLLDNGLFPGNVTPRVDRARAFLSTMLEGLQHKLFTIKNGNQAP